MFVKINAVQETMFICMCAKFGNGSFKIAPLRIEHDFFKGSAKERSFEL